MMNGTMKTWMVWVLIVLIATKATATDSDSKPQEKNERMGRSWNHPSLFNQHQMLMQHQQPNLPSVSTNPPGEAPNQQPSPNQQQTPNDLNVPNRNFEDHDKNIPAASEQDFLSRHYGYMNMNIHRFDQNYPYYERNVYPRYPSNHAPRFGPGYRTDKYGQGYGYSCKQGDDCDEVRAANQLKAAQPFNEPNTPPHNPMMNPFNNLYPEMAPYPSSFHNMMPPFAPYGGSNNFGSAPARFNDPHAPPPFQHQSMMPHRPYFQARYLHDQEEDVSRQHQEVSHPQVGMKGSAMPTKPHFQAKSKQHQQQEVSQQQDNEKSGPTTSESRM